MTPSRINKSLPRKERGSNLPPNPRYSWGLSEQSCSAAEVGGVSSSVWRSSLFGFIPPSVIANGAIHCKYLLCRWLGHGCLPKFLRGPAPRSTRSGAANGSFPSPRNLITLVLQDGARLLVRSSTDQGVATAQNPRKRIFPLQDL